MSEITTLIAAVKAGLLELGKQTKALGEGLQNVSPGVKPVTGSQSVPYLLAISTEMIESANQLDAFDAE